MILLSTLVLGQLNELMQVAEKLSGGGASLLNTFLILVMLSALVILHRENKKDSAERAESDNEKFKTFVEHHELLVANVNSERALRTEAMMTIIRENGTIIKENAVAMSQMAKSNESICAIAHGLADLIRERIKP